MKNSVSRRDTGNTFVCNVLDRSTMRRENKVYFDAKTFHLIRA